MLTRYGTCPGVKSSETEVQAWHRQQNYYGKQRVHRIFCPSTLLGSENSSARNARELALNLISPAEDLVISCKMVGPEFPARVAELKKARRERATQLGVEPGRTRIIIYHEPENLTVDAYNLMWDTAVPTLEVEADWLEPGTCHTGFWSRDVDENGNRENDWRVWIPRNPRVQRRLCFVAADLYPAAGRPTKSKPKYYEPPSAHTSPYTANGTWTEIGFCGILDEMLAELRGDKWPEIGVDLEGGIAEINHERASTASGWPFTDVNGAQAAEWLDAVLGYAYKRYAFATYFHKGGGILTDRSPQVEAEVLRDWIRTTYDDVEPDPGPEQPDPTHPQYGYGYDAGYDVGYEAGKLEGRVEGHAEGVTEGRTEIATLVTNTVAPYIPTEPPGQ